MRMCSSSTARARGMRPLGAVHVWQQLPNGAIQTKLIMAAAAAMKAAATLRIACLHSSIRQMSSTPRWLAHPDCCAVSCPIGPIGFFVPYIEKRTDSSDITAFWSACQFAFGQQSCARSSPPTMSCSNNDPVPIHDVGSHACCGPSDTGHECRDYSNAALRDLPWWVCRRQEAAFSLQWTLLWWGVPQPMPPSQHSGSRRMCLRPHPPWATSS